MKPTIAVALSGGVDSLVAACLLKEAGHPVFGIHFITGYESIAQTKRTDHSIASPRIEAIMETAHTRMRIIEKQLGLPVHVVNLCREFQEDVVDYFSKTYKEGKTPNPCLVCNPKIKFGSLLEKASKLGASSIATGHYAGIKKDAHGNLKLFKGKDASKDQSYFLAFMTTSQLHRAVFPLGEFTKPQVKKMADKRGLQPVSRSESQDICFIQDQPYGEFLNLLPKPGPIEKTDGTVIGEHQGLHLFTIGQRRGINCPGPEPYYVVHIDTDRNRLIVGVKKDLLKSLCRVEKINWIQPIPETAIPVEVRVRYRHPAVQATLIPDGYNGAVIRFDQPQTAITPGQGAVFYIGDELLGGGWIH